MSMIDTGVVIKKSRFRNIVYTQFHKIWRKTKTKKIILYFVTLIHFIQIKHVTATTTTATTAATKKGLMDGEVGCRVETIQMTPLLRTARIVGRVLET